MGKSSGGTRNIKPTSGNIAFNRSVFENEVAMPDIVKDQSYFSDKSGGYSLFMEGHNYVAEEVEAARILADEGYVTVLTPENMSIYATKKVGKKEQFSDGLIAGFYYEQKTPNPKNVTPEGLANSVNNALQHARDKGAKVAVIFDKYKVYHQADIDAGIKLFEQHNKYKFQSIVTINTVHKKKVNFWEHN